MPFNSYLTRHEATLNELLNSVNIPSERIREAISYSLFPGGKRMRPLLVYLCGEIVGVDLSVLDLIAASIEFIHCYSLVHDDLPAMDNDDYRRGKLSCHKAFDEATAILAGDGMQALAVDFLLSNLPNVLSTTQVIATALELVRASGVTGMVSGQSLDLTELSTLQNNEDQLRFIHSLKTGKLISACIKMVLASGHPSEIMTTALESYASHLGLVFQMQDDYLDAYASVDILGKKRASDSANKKQTFASYYSKADLLTLIAEYFRKTKNTLTPLEQQACNLLSLTNSMILIGADQ